MIIKITKIIINFIFVRSILSSILEFLSFIFNRQIETY